MEMKIKKKKWCKIVKNKAEEKDGEKHSEKSRIEIYPCKAVKKRNE